MSVLEKIGLLIVMLAFAAEAREHNIQNFLTFAFGVVILFLGDLFFAVAFN